MNTDIIPALCQFALNLYFIWQIRKLNQKR